MPNIRAQVSGNPANLSGNVDVNVANFGPGASRAFVLMDGQFVREIIGFSDPNSGVSIDSNTYNNGQHEIKAVTVDYFGDVTVSDKVEVNFNNELYCVSKPDSFEEGKDYPVLAMFSESNDLRVRLVDWDGTEAYTSPAMSGGINLAIPENAFTRQIYDLKIEKQATSWEGIYQHGLGKTYIRNFPYEFAIFLPVTDFPIPPACRKETVAEIEKICEDKGMLYVVLYEGQCTWDNFASVLSKGSVRYTYMVTHGHWATVINNQLVQRTRLLLDGSQVISYWSPGFPPEGGSIHYMHSLNLWRSERMKIVHIDACYSALFDDMAQQWINDQIPILGQLYIGWQDEIYCGDGWDTFSRNIWYSLGERETNFFWALNYALSQNQNPQIPDIFRYIGDDQVCFP